MTLQLEGVVRGLVVRGLVVAFLLVLGLGNSELLRSIFGFIGVLIEISLANVLVVLVITDILVPVFLVVSVLVVPVLVVSVLVVSVLSVVESVRSSADSGVSRHGDSGGAGEGYGVVRTGLVERTLGVQRTRGVVGQAWSVVWRGVGWVANWALELAVEASWETCTHWVVDRRLVRVNSRVEWRLLRVNSSAEWR